MNIHVGLFEDITKGHPRIAIWTLVSSPVCCTVGGSFNLSVQTVSSFFVQQFSFNKWFLTLACKCDCLMTDVTVDLSAITCDECIHSFMCLFTNIIKKRCLRNDVYSSKTNGCGIHFPTGTSNIFLKLRLNKGNVPMLIRFLYIWITWSVMFKIYSDN